MISGRLAMSRPPLLGETPFCGASFEINTGLVPCQDRDMHGSPDISTEGSSRRRFLGRLLLLVAVAIAFFPLLESFETEVTLRYRLGEAHARYDELELRYFHEDEEVAGGRFSFPGGAPTTFDHKVSLPRGEVRVEVALRGDGAKTSRSHRFHTPA